MTFHKNTDASKITFDLHNKETILTEQLSIKPLKIVNPKSQKQTGVCMLTSYGGGFVEGDSVELDVVCKENTTSIISSQANTRVYESNGIVCKQALSLMLKKKAFHVFFNDPLVMHNGGNFVQKNSIHLEENSVLLFIDWFSAGRTANGESFDFKNFETSTKIEIGKDTVLWDNFKITPENMDVYSPGMFGNHTSFLNLFLIGNKKLSKVKRIEKALLRYGEVNENNKLQSNITRINENGLVGRYSADKVTSLKEIVIHVSEVLAHPDLLNYDHLERKY